MEIDDLYPAVIECFTIILLGYAAGKTGIISTTETKGLNTFIGTFALPSLIFMSMAQLDLSSVNWYFLLAICLAKAIVFFSVVIITLVVNRPIRLDKAGLFAIFCTQSNDFALGYPIIAALYDRTHPEYKTYLYLVAPVSLIILNPVAFILMEISKQRDFENAEFENTHIRKSESILKVAKQVSKGVMLNPIVLMTALGICGNLIFSHCVPDVLARVLNTLGGAFSASALFSLGLTMVGSAATLKGAGLVVPGILITLKLLVLPVVTREVVSLINAGVDANDTISLSNYGFLYGTFPTAPGVFVYAIQYDLAVEMVAGGMVACTFLSAPLMFVSAKMITLKNELNPSDYVPDLDTFLFNMSIIGLLATIWVLVVFILSHKWRKVPYSITFCLVISQAIGCIGAILWSSFGPKTSDDWKLYLQFSVFSFGVLSTRIWTAILAASLVFLRCRSLCFVLRMKHYMWMIGWGIPVLLIAMLLLIVKGESLKEKLDPNFQYGETQALVAVLVLVCSFIVTIGCLVMQQRYDRRYAQYQSLQPQAAPSTQTLQSTIAINNDDDDEVEQQRESTQPKACCSKMNGCAPCRPGLAIPTAKEMAKTPPPCVSLNCRTCYLNVGGYGGCGLTVNNTGEHEKYNPTVVKAGANGTCPKICISEIEDLVVMSDAQDNSDEDDDDIRNIFSYNDDLCSPSKHPCDAAQRRRCTQLLEKYRRMNQLTEPEEIGIVRDRDDEYQMLRHIILLLVLSASMFVGIALCIWTLIMEDISGIYVELTFLDAALNFGQGFFTFMLFGLNTRMIIMPLHKWWRRLAYGEGSVFLPKWEDIPIETKQICEQFLTYHIDKCVHDIVRDRRWRMESYSKVFCGHEFVDWLLLVGLARDRSEAVKYGRHLLIGRVLRHVKNLHHFHDQAFFYTFCPLEVE